MVRVLLGEFSEMKTDECRRDHHDLELNASRGSTVYATAVHSGSLGLSARIHLGHGCMSDSITRYISYFPIMVEVSRWAGPPPHPITPSIPNNYR
jgi:hypothetical protein